MKVTRVGLLLSNILNYGKSPMTNYLAANKRGITSKACRLFLFIIALMPVLLLPQPALAQRETIDMTLWLRSGKNYYDNVARAGQDNKFFLEVRNVGTKPITNIKFSSDVSEDWIVEFNPVMLDYIDPGILQTVDVNIRPPENASRGEHAINIIAQANEIRKVENVSVTVSLASYWLWVWGGLILVIVVVFYFIYRHVSRQK